MHFLIHTVAVAPLLLLSAMPSTAGFATLDRRDNSSAELPSRLIVQLQDTWFESIAVRPNGNLLLTTVLPNATLYEVSHLDSNSPSINPIFTVDSITSFSGISEIGDDKYAIAGGSLEGLNGIEGSWGVWTVDFTHSCRPQLKEAIPLPGARFLNGLSSVPGYSDLAVVADSTNGVVYHVNVTSGDTKISQSFDEMKATAGNPFGIGINGLHMHKGYLYFTNLSTHTFYRVKVNSDGTTADGSQVEIVAKIASETLDDFAFGPGEEDTAWLATNTDGSIVAASLAGEMRVVAGGANSTTIPGDTSCQFGRGATDTDVLYVATSEGKVQAFDTSRFSW